MHAWVRILMCAWVCGVGFFSDSLARVSHLCVLKCATPRRLLVVALTDTPPVPYVFCFPQFLESNGHTFVVTSDKDGAGCKLEKELEDADVVISQPFYPFYLTEVPWYHLPLPATSCCLRASCLSLAFCTSQVHRVFPWGGVGSCGRSLGLSCCRSHSLPTYTAWRHYR